MRDMEQVLISHEATKTYFATPSRIEIRPELSLSSFQAVRLKHWPEASALNCDRLYLTGGSCGARSGRGYES